MKGKRQQQRGGTTDALQGVLARVLQRHPGSRRAIAQILSLLEEMLDQAAGGARSPEGQTPAPRRLRRGAAVEGYTVEQTSHGPVLIERRFGSSQDFRCPQPVYAATAQAVAEQRDAAPFDAILSSATRILGGPPSDYLCRMCLRFWMNITPPLVMRARARYRPASLSRFMRDAQAAWDNLARKGNQNRNQIAR